jgi:hypothetical protein
MSAARGIVSGVVVGTPTSKISKAGNAYASASIREGSGEAARWWKLFVFNEALVEEILRFVDGEPIAVAGEFDAEIYAPSGGEPRISWRVRADAILSARAKPKPKAEKAARPAPPGNGRDVAASSWARPDPKGGALDDGLPF